MSSMNSKLLPSDPRLNPGPAHRIGPAPADDMGPALAPGRALVAISPPRPQACRMAAPSAAFFLAHLISTAQQAPQTRERRRMEPALASALYAAPPRTDARPGRSAASGYGSQISTAVEVRVHNPVPPAKRMCRSAPRCAMVRLSTRYSVRPCRSISDKGITKRQLTPIAY